MSCSQSTPPLPNQDLDHVFTLTQSLWKEAGGARFLITGGTGFFGIWLLESFLHINRILGLGMSAVVVTRDPEAIAKKAPHVTDCSELEFLKGDIRRFPFPEGEFPYVIHAATEASAKLNAENPREMYDSIVSGTEHVLRFAAQCGTRKLLLTSSGAVYGRQPAEMTHVPETYSGAPDPLQTASAYGIGKRASEHLAVLVGAAHGFEVKVARCFAFVGPHLPLDAHFAIGNFLSAALRGVNLEIRGDGTPYRSFLYASDLAVALWTILFKGASARAYNVGSRYDLTISELARLVKSTFEVPGPIQTLKASPRVPTATSRYVPEVSRAELELGLRERILLPEALRKTAEWYRSQITSESNPSR